MDEDRIWTPIQADYDGFCIEIYYTNDLGEEHVHVTDSWGLDIRENSLRSLCWAQCSGDWPGCKMECPLFTGPVNELLTEWREYEKVPSLIKEENNDTNSNPM